MEDNEIKIEVGKRFKHARESLGQEQAGFAETLGITPMTLKKIESGKSYPPVPCLLVLAELGISMNWLIGGDESKKPVLQPL